MIGKQLSPILAELEEALWEYEANVGFKTQYTDEGFRAGVKIFMSVLMDRMWELQSLEKMTIEDRSKMVVKCAEDVRKLVKVYTNVDTLTLYNDGKNDINGEV